MGAPGRLDLGAFTGCGGKVRAEVELEGEGGAGGLKVEDEAGFMFKLGVVESFCTISPGRNKVASDLYFGTEGVHHNFLHVSNLLK